MTDRASDPLPTGWGRRFFLVSALQLLCYLNYQMLNPVLAIYLVSLGYSAAFIGLVVGAFGVASVLFRPYIGRGVDQWSGVGTYLAGTGAIVVGTLGYLVVSTPVLIISRLIHGTGWAAINTAGPSIALGNAPDDRKGAAIGYFNTFRAVTIPLGPALGLWAAQAYGFQAVFLLAGGLALAAFLATPLLRDQRRAHRGSPAPGGLIEARVLIPAGIQVLLYCSAPLIFVFMPLFAADRSIDGLPWFFVAAGLTSIAVQPLARLSDTRGRGPNVAAGLALSSLGLLVLVNASHLGLLVVGGVFWAGGLALVEPATTALAVESVPLARRGAALATYGAAFQVGNGAGGVLWGFLIAGFGFEWAFLGAVLLVGAAGVLLAIHWRWIMGPRAEVDELVA